MDTKTDLKQPLLQKPLSVPQKKILYDQAFLATFAWASSNFFFGILSAHNFATSCLQFSGYILFSLFIRIFQAWKSGNGLYTPITPFFPLSLHLLPTEPPNNLRSLLCKSCPHELWSDSKLHITEHTTQLPFQLLVLWRKTYLKDGIWDKRGIHGSGVDCMVQARDKGE
ncbi:hypothetical protein FGO68_gene8910 [Halteria grandinella]|uniref:Uncharacterized protein n=1 Tax=Halteria grandinella TaxID=5974 RepID=A0A8J8NKV6_HALGN|nr:hypothetical protein FGO68_gene8910 [Halteria grandinella]